VIPADLGAELATAVGQLVAAGHLPASAAALTAAGTWRPAPAPRAVPGGAAPDGAARTGAPPDLADGPAAARYATSLPFELARRAGEEPAGIAARLGRAIVAASWITSAEVTGAGYLTIGVTAGALSAVAVRVSQAGPACLRSDALRGDTVPVPSRPDLAAGPTWPRAWRDQAAALSARLALAAGAAPGPPAVQPAADAMTAARQPPAAGAGEPPAARTGDQPAAGASVAAAVAYAGADAVRYWLARLPAARAGVLDRMERAARHLGRDTPAPPFPAPPIMARDLDAVRFACADAAATLRWAAELGAARTGPPAPATLSHPAQIALLTQLSWLPERVAAAARRRQPDELPRALESLAAAWLDCRESCPALPFGGRDAPAAGAGTSARLWLADATRAALAAGLELAGVIATAPGSEYL
jgi:DALR anticodon binding domain/Arginyl tRNA synthetase N terminal domain